MSYLSTFKDSMLSGVRWVRRHLDMFVYFVDNLYLRLRYFVLHHIFSVKQGNDDWKYYSVCDLEYSFSVQRLHDEWLVGTMPWGFFNSQSPHQYFCGDNDCVSVSGNALCLYNVYKPTSIPKWYDGRSYNPAYAIGLICSKKEFGYGFYVFKAKIPFSSGIWPAIWLTSTQSWPPEIDIMEAYIGCDYHDISIESNLHYKGENGVHKVLGAVSHTPFVPYDILSYSLYFDENKIEIFYQGFLVRRVKAKHILERFIGHKYHVVVNNALRQSSVQQCHPAVFRDVLNKQPFILYQFDYYVIKS